MDHGASSYRRFLQGDDSGFEELVRTYSDGLILYLYGYVSDFHLAEDLCEDTFFRLLVKKPRFDGRSGFKTFLYAIGRRVAADHLRKKRGKDTVSLEALAEEGFDLPAKEDVVAAYLRDETHRAVHRALGRLKDTHREILWLVYFEELSVKEAAGVLGKSPHAAESLIHRARLSMKAELDKEGITNEDL